VNNKNMTVAYTDGPVDTQRVSGTSPFKRCTLADGTPWVEFFRIDGGYLLRFPKLADFAVSVDGLRVTCQSTTGVSEETLRRLYLGHVLPLALSRQRKLVFHGSAVAVDHLAVSFLASSGKGKSTLAASFAISGFPFLTDDGLIVEESHGRIIVRPSHPSLRLWEDSQSAIVPSQATLAPPVQYTPKARIFAGNGILHCAETILLRCVFFLGDGTATAPLIKALRPRDALIKLVEHSFLLDTDKKEMIGFHLDALSKLVKNPIFFELDYPRRFDALPAVREAVISHIKDQASVSH
jgi:hypothetical protein